MQDDLDGFLAEMQSHVPPMEPKPSEDHHSRPPTSTGDVTDPHGHAAQLDLSITTRHTAPPDNSAVTPRDSVAQLEETLKDKLRLLVAKDTQIANLTESLSRAETRAGIRSRERELEAEISELRMALENLSGDLTAARDASSAREKELTHVREAAEASEAALRKELVALKEGTPSKHVFKAGMVAATDNVHDLRELNEELQQQVWEKDDQIYKLQDSVA